MVLFLLGLLIGSFFGMMIMALFAAGKREDALMDEIRLRIR